jgi:hypothetical protein
LRQQDANRQYRHGKSATDSHCKRREPDERHGGSIFVEVAYPIDRPTTSGYSSG